MTALQKCSKCIYRVTLARPRPGLSWSCAAVTVWHLSAGGVLCKVGRGVAGVHCASMGESRESARENERRVSSESGSVGGG